MELIFRQYNINTGRDLRQSAGLARCPGPQVMFNRIYVKRDTLNGGPGDAKKRIKSCGLGNG